ncbi:dihydroorotate dehydrogenase electron transfer subunit [soil metagenome]
MSTAVGDRPQAPFGARDLEVVERRTSGGYVVFSALDTEGPEPAPGQFYMLSAPQRWGREEGRPFLPRAFSVAEAEAGSRGVRLDFLVEAVGPGTRALAELEPGERLTVTGPLGKPFSAPQDVVEGAQGAILVGGGIGIAPLAMLRRQLSSRGFPLRSLLGFRDEGHSGGDELFRCSEVGWASEDGHRGHRGYVTDLLESALKGDGAGLAAVYACGPPPMLEAVRRICEARGASCELAMESPMACGYGACFGCVVPLRDGTYIRLCVDGPVVRGDQLESAMVAGAGHR